MVTAVHVYDGESPPIANFNNLKLTGDHLMEKFAIKVKGAHPEIKCGLGISVQVGFAVDVSNKTIHLISAGCDFV
ncbi:MAG: hypothetical protein JW918_16325 [Anaerolineae bacterium]|nr:hypothetical protein [Anaerolineae bacterium]